MNNKFLKGLWQDARPVNQPDGTYFFGKNGIQYHTTGSIKNELGFNDVSVTAPGAINGVIETDSKAVIFSTDGVVSYIGYYNPDTNEYEAILNDSAFPDNDKLNFDPYHYITGEFHRNHKNEIVVYFTDKFEKPKVINCDDTGNISTATEMLMFLQADIPEMQVDVTTGGNLTKGAYYVFFKYLNLDGASTGYILQSGAKFVSSSDASTTTDKSLTITVDELDGNFDLFQIAIVSRIGGTYAAFELDPMQVNDEGPTTVVYNGENLTTSITLEEVITPHPVYVKVGTMGQLNDSLYIADLESEPELNLQRYVNNIKLRVKSELIEATPPPDEHVAGNTRSLMHQEVYAVYIRFKRKGTGTWTKAFHIPGNAPIGTDDSTASGPHEGELDALNFHVTDTVHNPDLINKTVDTGIWINENEEYPTVDDFNSNDIGGLDLRGENVRHHRMPSIAWCKQNFYPGEPDYGRSKLDVLSLEVSNLSLPIDIRDQLVGYEILIAKRNISNATVVGQALLLVSSQSVANATANNDLGFTSTGGNWNSLAYNDTIGPGNLVRLLVTGRTPLPTNPPNAPARASIRFRLHSFDMLFSKPAVTPSYMSAQLKMRVSNLAPFYPTGGYIEAGEGLGVDGVAPGYPIIAIIDYTKGIPPTATLSTERVRVVENTRYLPNNVLAGRWDNRDLESAFVGSLKWIGADGDIADNDLPLSISTSYPRLDEDQALHERIQWEETYLVNLMDHKTNVYLSVFSQTLIASGVLQDINSIVTQNYVGDVFINDYSFHTYGLLNADNVTNQDNEDPTRYNGYKIVRRFVTEAVSNINLRYEVEGNIYSKWWPNTPLAAAIGANDTSPYLYQQVRSIDPNQFGYSKDFNALNELTNTTPFNPFAEVQNVFPHRIHRGGKTPRQGKARSWRTFLPLDYYEAPKIFGAIKRVLGKDDKLLIHYENALLATQDKVKLEADLLSVTLGSGDIFQFDPQEIQSAKQGYAGTQHELAAVDTPAGYIFVDAKAGQIFIYKQGIKLVNNGLNQLFQQYLKQVTEDNPFATNGITIGYDREYKRILLTVKNKQLVADLDNFVPGYEPTADFITGLSPSESIVYRNGKYVRYLGVYEEEGFVCDECAQPTAENQDLGFIDENSPVGTFVGDINVDALEPITLDNQYNSFVIISGNTGGAFSLIGDELYVANSVALDYETTPQFILTVRATTNCGKFVDIEVTVSLNDVNEPPIADSTEFTIMESTPLLTELYEIPAIDPEGTTLTFTLDTLGTPFTVDPSSGIITLTGILDKDTTPFYILSITITDEDNLETTITIRINIDDTILYFTGEDGECVGDDLVYASVAVRANAEDGAVLAIYDNDGLASYQAYPVPEIDPVLGAAECTDPPEEESQFLAINNSTGVGNTLDAVETVMGSVFYILDSGTFPLAMSAAASGIGVTSSSIKVFVTLTASVDVNLYKNGVILETITIPTSGFGIIDPVPFTSTDSMVIELVDTPT